MSRQAIGESDYGLILPGLAEKGNIEEVRSILKRGVNPNVRDVFEDTALILAANRGHANVVSVLLEYGADPYLKGEDNDTALSLAVETGCAEVVNSIIVGVATSRGNEGKYWDKMVKSYLKKGKVQECLDQKTATLLAVILPDGDLRESIISGFNQRNPESNLSQTKIDRLKQLRTNLANGFIGRDLLEGEKVEILTNIAIKHLVINPENLIGIKNYIESGLYKNFSGKEMPDLDHAIIAAQGLSESQNMVFYDAMCDLIPSNATRINDMRSVSGKGGCCVIQ